MIGALRQGVEGMAARFGADRLFAHRRRNTLAIVMYHGVVAEPLVPFCWHQVPLAAFERQMTWLARHRTVLPLDEALDRLDAGTLPRDAAAITFDDGYRNNLTRAFPVLERHHLPATLFLVTGLRDASARVWVDLLWRAIRDTRASRLDAGELGLGELSLGDDDAKGLAIARVVEALKLLPTSRREAASRRLFEALDAATTIRSDEDFALLSDEELRALTASGLVTLAPHTRTHPILSRCDDARIEDEVRGSIDDIAHRTGAPPRVFAYPNGRAIDFDDRARAHLRHAGVRHALSTRHGLARQGDDPLALPRIAVGADLSFARFRLLMAGVKSRHA